jgi:regulator of CtrA degradation
MLAPTPLGMAVANLGHPAGRRLAAAGRKAKKMNETGGAPMIANGGMEDGRWRAGVVQDFARSELFERTFQEGMELVEETASYLDGAGRQESKHLDRKAALAYASESMRLTTRLMQVASWLLVQRAVREGEMDPAHACDARYRLAREAASAPTDADVRGRGRLPVGLVDLLERSDRLYERVMHLDRRMYLDPAEGEQPHPVLSQIERLQAAFRR